MRRWSLPFVLLFIACEPDSSAIVSNGEAVAHEPVGVAVIGPSGDRPDALLVRAVAADLTSAGPAVVTALVDGQPVEVEVDGRGYGTLTLESPGSVVLRGLGAERAVVHDRPWRSDWGLAHPALPDIVGIEPGGRGSLVASGPEVWWVGAELPPHVVARFSGPEPVTVRAVAIDDDGVLDAIAWAGDQVIALRGRDGGGASFGARIVAPGWEVRGADVRDIDGDGRRDLAIAWNADGVGTVQIWAGDGLWAFEPMVERTIASPPVDVAAARDRGDGLMLVTALTEDGSWQRLVRDGDGGWRLTGPPLPNGAVAGSQIRSGGDYDGSGADNLVVIPPRVDEEPRELTVWQLDADPPRFLRPTFIGGHVAFGDLEGEGRPNVVGFEQPSRVLSYIAWDGERAVSREVATFDRFGPFGLGAIDANPTPDLLLAGDLLTWYAGIDDREPASRWRPVRPGGASFSLLLDGPVAMADDGQVIGITRVGDSLRVSELRFDGLAPVAEAHVIVGRADEPVLELVHCGSSAWLSTATQVIEIAVGQDVAGVLSLTAPHGLACGPALGASRAVVVEGGDAVVLGAGATLRDRVPLGGAVAAALLRDGDEVSVVGCSGPCVVARGASADVLAVGGPEGLEASGPFGTRRYPGADARPSLVELDGDGEPELAWRWGAGFVGLLRIVDEDLAEPTYLHVDQVGPGVPVAAGLAGSRRDLWFRVGQQLRGARPQ